MAIPRVQNVVLQYVIVREFITLKLVFTCFDRLMRSQTEGETSLRRQ